MNALPAISPTDRRLSIETALAAVDKRLALIRLAKPRARRVAAAVADLRPAPSSQRSIDAQLLFGEAVDVHAEGEGWCCVRSAFDGYVGWMKDNELVAPLLSTHVVAAPRTFSYPGPDLKLPALRALSMGSQLAVIAEAETRNTRYVQTADGEWLVARHVRPQAERAADYVGVAEQLLATPYLWGGGSGFGLDCSGLVQLAMRMCGRMVLRDSDMQAATIGSPIDPGRQFDALCRGDLIFWSGHVAICTGDDGLLHANGASMDVRAEPLAAAISRIAKSFAEPIGFRRP